MKKLLNFKKKWLKLLKYYKYFKLIILQKKSLKERIEWGKEQREKGNEYYKQKVFEKV